MNSDSNPHIGSSFDSWLEENDLLEDASSFAIKEIIALQIAEEMKRKGISKSHMAEIMHTSRSQVDRLLDPNNNSATLETLMKAAKAVGKELRLELI